MSANTRFLERNKLGLSMKNLSAEEITAMLELPTDDPLKKWNTLRKRLLHDAPVRELVIALQQAHSQYGQNMLMHTLGMLGAKSALPVLASYIDDPNPSRRGLAVDVIGRIAVINTRRRGKGHHTPYPPDIGERIMQRFEKTEPLEELRPGLALALGALHFRPATPSLIEALGSAEVGLRVCAAVALGQLHAPEAIPALDSARERESDKSARRQIDYVIARIMESSTHAKAEGNGTEPSMV
ncbi:MAG: HEAT repeat domain-containing protein [Thermomicrobiales bacterium]